MAKDLEAYKMCFGKRIDVTFVGDLDELDAFTGVRDGYYYENDELVKGKGIVEYEGKLYFVRNDGSIYTNGRLKVTEVKANGLIAAGSYRFGADGVLAQ